MRIKDIQYLQDGGKTWDKFSIPQRRAYITNYLKKKGYNDVQTHAIVGNLQQENGRFDISFANSSSGALGVAQWLGSRKKKLLKKGDPNNINTQLDFLHEEMSGESEWTNNIGGRNAFFNAKDIPTAVKVFRKDFERPGEHEANDNKRVKYAYQSAGYKDSDIPNYEQLEYTDPNYQSIPLMNYYNSMMGMTQAMFDQIHAQAELDFQQEIKDKEEAELKAIQTQFENKQKEKQQFLGMVPQVSSVEANEMIQPKMFQVGGAITGNNVLSTIIGGISNEKVVNESKIPESYELSPTTQSYNAIPIYKDMKDFGERNKNVTTSLPKMVDGVVTYEETPLFYKESSNDDVYFKFLDENLKDNDGNIVQHVEQCTARACRVVDALVGGSNYFNYSDEFKKDIKAETSTATKPTEEEIKNTPYYYDDTEFGSLDAWDIAYTVGKNSPKNVMFDALGGERTVDVKEASDKLLSYNDVMAKYKIPIGSIINMGTMIETGNSSKFKGGSHTVRVVGYQEDGEPLVADYGNIVKLKDAKYIDGTLDKQSIVSIVTIPSKEKYDFDYFKNIKNKSKQTSKENYISKTNKVPTVNDDGEIEMKKPSNEYKKYSKTINENKNYLTALSGMSDEDYDRYAKIALTLPGVETKYGGDFLYSLGIDGESTGLSQLIGTNVSDKYSDILSKYKKGSTENDALSTILYLKELDGYKDKWFDDAESETERPYYLTDRSVKGVLKDGVRAVQGRDKTGFYNNIGSGYTYNVDGVELEIPSKSNNESEESYMERVNSIISDKNLRFDLVDRGGEEKRPTIFKTTQGNKIDRDLEHSVGYLWQSPNSVRYGDAQGNSKYYNKYRKIYNELFNKK